MQSIPSTPKRRKHRTKSISEQVMSVTMSPMSPAKKMNTNRNNNSSLENNPFTTDYSSLGTDSQEIGTVYAVTDSGGISEEESDSEDEGEDESERVNFGNHSNKEAILNKVENVSSVLVIILEQIISSITFLLPNSFIKFCTVISKFLFSIFKSNNEAYNDFIRKSEDVIKGEILEKVEKLRNFQNFHQICELNGFSAESHLVHTDDGFKLTLHRLNPEKNGFVSNGRAVYFQHGLLMTSDVWCVMLNKDENLPFRLCELGFDVFLGNNRGNKYSNKHVSYSAGDNEFWNFSIDEFAMYDIPCSINYILNLKNIGKLIYIGFSQGCSQILSSVSINDDLNDKIEKLILIAPATTPKKLSNWLINSIINFDPGLIYLLFGRRILMKSVMFWRKITYPPMFVKLIDIPVDILFDWKSNNIDIIQKLVSYYHLYSTTSVKCIVHWFQIMKAKKFQMYQEQDYFEPFEYPTNKTIRIKKLLLIYGMSDSLVDIDVIVGQLPEYRNLKFTQMKDGAVVGKKQLVDNIEVDNMGGEEEDDNYKVKLDDNCSELRIFGINNYEHLDLLWGKYMDENVIKNVVEFIE